MKGFLRGRILAEDQLTARFLFYRESNGSKDKIRKKAEDHEGKKDRDIENWREPLDGTEITSAIGQGPKDQAGATASKRRQQRSENKVGATASKRQRQGPKDKVGATADSQ